MESKAYKNKDSPQDCGDLSTVKSEKIKFPLYLHTDTMGQVEMLYKSDNCTSKIEFLEKAMQKAMLFLMNMTHMVRLKKVNSDGTMNLTEYDGLQREKATYFQSSESGTKQILTQTAYEFAGHSFDIYTALNNASSHSYKGLKTTKTTYIIADKQVFTETLTDRKKNVIYEKVNGETKRTSEYYANGQLARQTDALDNTTKYEYGFLNKVTKTC